MWDRKREVIDVELEESEKFEKSVVIDRDALMLDSHWSASIGWGIFCYCYCCIFSSSQRSRKKSITRLMLFIWYIVNICVAQVWDLSTQGSWYSIACKVTMIGHQDTVRCLQVDDEKVISGSYDKTLKIWDIRTGQCSKTLRWVQHWSPESEVGGSIPLSTG
jgi:WD40 repeat protein